MILIQNMDMPRSGEFSHVRIYGDGDVTTEVSGKEHIIGTASGFHDLLTAEWIKAAPYQSKGWTYICSCCNGRNYFLKTPGKYCSQCGAVMRPYVEGKTCSTV